MNEPGIWQTLLTLVETLLTLVVQLTSLGFHWIILVLWLAWCLWGVNWYKARHMLAVGGWAPVVLLMILISLVWSRLIPDSGPSFLPLPNFWWQLAYVTILGALAMFAGWLQSVLHWTPREISFDPPAHEHGHGHGHDHGHGHHH